MHSGPPAGRCPVCGRDRSLTWSGAPVSCCFRPLAERAPERRSDAEGVFRALARFGRRVSAGDEPAVQAVRRLAMFLLFLAVAVGAWVAVGLR